MAARQSRLMCCRYLRFALVAAIVLGTAAEVDSPGRDHFAHRRLQAVPSPSGIEAPPPPPAPCTSNYPSDYDYEACLPWCINNLANKCARDHIHSPPNVTGMLTHTPRLHCSSRTVAAAHDASAALARFAACRHHCHHCRRRCRTCHARHPWSRNPCCHFRRCLQPHARANSRWTTTSKRASTGALTTRKLTARAASVGRAPFAACHPRHHCRRRRGYHRSLRSRQACHRPYQCRVIHHCLHTCRRRRHHQPHARANI